MATGVKKLCDQLKARRSACLLLVERATGGACLYALS